MPRKKVVIPLYIQTAKFKKNAKKYWLNMNNFNKRKGFGYNNIKQKFTNDLSFDFQASKINELVFEVTYGNKRRVDRDNYVSALRKFFQDALVVHGVIEDDTDEYIGKCSDLPMKYSKGEYFCVVTIDYESKQKL